MRQQLDTNTHGGILKTLEKHLMSNVIFSARVLHLIN